MSHYRLLQCVNDSALKIMINILKDVKAHSSALVHEATPRLVGNPFNIF